MKNVLVGGNWKMNGCLSLVSEFRNLQVPLHVETIVFPPFTLLKTAKETWNFPVGAQNVNGDPQKGAQTGEISPEMLKNLGLDWVIIGHSERRTLFNEADQVINLFMTILLDSWAKIKSS
jgi:triosephosphate isomerase (TIM)